MDRAQSALPRWISGGVTSMRCMRASRPRVSKAMCLSSNVSVCDARISSRSSTAWKWISLRIFVRRTRRRWISIAIASRALLGRLSVRVFGLGEEDGILLAHHLGRALQLTNILRDIDEDAGLGRLYLPRESLNAAGITSNDPATVVSDPRLPQVCDDILKQAINHFVTSDAIMARNPRRLVRAPKIMSEYYHAILNKLVERGFALPRRPVKLSKAAKIFILIRYAFI